MFRFSLSLSTLAWTDTYLLSSNPELTFCRGECVYRYRWQTLACTVWGWADWEYWNRELRRGNCAISWKRKNSVTTHQSVDKTRKFSSAEKIELNVQSKIAQNYHYDPIQISKYATPIPKIHILICIRMYKIQITL